MATTYECLYENGVIRLPESIRLADRTKVYVVIPAPEKPTAYHIVSPRLSHREQAADFVLEMIDEQPDAPVR